MAAAPSLTRLSSPICGSGIVGGASLPSRVCFLVSPPHTLLPLSAIATGHGCALTSGEGMAAATPGSDESILCSGAVPPLLFPPARPFPPVPADFGSVRCNLRQRRSTTDATTAAIARPPTAAAIIIPEPLPAAPSAESLESAAALEGGSGALAGSIANVGGVTRLTRTPSAVEAAEGSSSEESVCTATAAASADGRRMVEETRTLAGSTVSCTSAAVTPSIREARAERYAGWSNVSTVPSTTTAKLTTATSGVAAGEAAGGGNAV